MASARYDSAELAAYREAIRFDDLLDTATGELETMNQVAVALELENV